MQMSQNIRFCLESYLNHGRFIFQDSKNLPCFFDGQGVGFSDVSEQLTVCKALEVVKPKDESLTILLGSQ